VQFLVLGYDRTDEGALDRRMALRDAHIALAKTLQASGNLLYGVAMLDEHGRMCGSVLVMEFDSRDRLDRYLQGEPYVTGKVWERWVVIPCKVGPMFTAVR